MWWEYETDIKWQVNLQDSRSNTAGPAMFEATLHSARLQHHIGRRGAVRSKASHGTGARFHCSQRTDMDWLCISMAVYDLKSLFKEKVTTPPAPWWFYCHARFALFCSTICRVSQELSHSGRPEGTLLLCLDLCVGLNWFSVLKLWK